MKKLLKKIGIIVAGLMLFAGTAQAVTLLTVPQGGTGVGTITGIIQGNGTSPFSAITVGTGLNFSGGTLSATGLAAALTNTHIFVGNASNVPADVALSLSATPGSFALANTGALTMPNADAGTRGLLSSTDWTIFSAKLSSALNGGHIFVGNGSNTATDVALTLSATPGTFGISNAGVLTMPNADTSTRGLLSSTDWNTFNGKQAAGNYITALTGDVTAAGPGSSAATIAANAVTYAKFQQVAASSLVGNPTGSLANASGITLGAGLSFSGTTLVSSTSGAPTSIGALDAQAANANGLALVSNVLSTQSADATHPGVVNNTTQTFSGTKTDTIWNATTQYNFGGNFFGSQDNTNASLYLGNGSAHAASTVNVTVLGVGSGGSLTNAATNNVVVGNASLTAGTTSSNDTILGAGAGTSAITSGQHTIIGSQACRSIDTSGSTCMGYAAAISSTNPVTAIGRLVASGLTTGSNGVVIGDSAEIGTTGSGNTVIGQGAGKSTSTASNTTIIGKGAGIGITSGNGLVAIGQGAGTLNTSGTFNISIGVNAQAGTTGTQNIAIGPGIQSSGANNTFVGGNISANASASGNNNTVMGHLAYNNATSGASNTGIGESALLAATSGGSNTALGQSAGSDITTSSHNIAIGDGNFTGNGGTNIVIGSVSGASGMSGNVLTILGSGAGVSLTSSSSDTLLGNAAGAGLSTGGANTCIGVSSCNGISTGAGNVFIGNSTSSAATTTGTSLCVGRGIVCASNQAIFGDSNGSGYTSINFGKGISQAAPSANVTLGVTGSNGTNGAGSNMVLAAGISTGTATPAIINFQTGTVTGSGSTPQTLSSRGNIDGVGALNWGSSSQFVLDGTGNITKLNNVTTSFPSSNSAGVLTNNGSGTLTWVAAGLSSTLTAGHIYVGNGSNVATDVALTLSATPGSFALANTGALTMPNADTSTRGLLSSADWNTFNGKISGVSFAAFGSTPNANGGSASGGTITLQPASASFPGGVTTGNQTMAGNKTFSSSVSTPQLYDVTGTNIVDMANGCIGLASSCTGHIGIDFLGGTLNDASGFPVVDWANQKLSDNALNDTLDWTNETLLNAAHTQISLDWANDLLKDQGGVTMLDWHLASGGLQTAQDFKLTAVGKGIFLKKGTNATMGTATLSGGTILVSTTAVKTGAEIMVTMDTPSGVPGFLSVPVATVVNGASFTINSTSVGDNSTVNWVIINAS